MKKKVASFHAWDLGNPCPGCFFLVYRGDSGKALLGGKGHYKML